LRAFLFDKDAQKVFEDVFKGMNEKKSPAEKADSAG
jgi:hypothetical protein